MAIRGAFCLELTLDNANGMGGNTFSASREAEFFFCRCLDINIFGGCAKRFCHSVFHFLYVGGKLGLLRNNGGIDIGNLVPVRCEYFTASCEYNKAGNALDALVIIGEVEADIALGASTENGIGNRVAEHVGIAVAEKAFFIFYLHAAENKIAPFHKAVNIITVSYSEIHFAASSSDCIIWRTRSKSLAKVIFILLSPHSTSFTLNPEASAREASSVA